MAKVTPADITRFNELYYQYKNKAKIARETGFSASTVSKYIDPNWKPIEEKNIIHFYFEDLPEFDEEKFKNIDNFGILCIYTTEEKEEIEKLWEEIN